MKIVVYNLGCKVNQYESDSIVKTLREQGYEVSEQLEVADAYILNTCAVTNEAEGKSRQCVSRCKKLNQNAKIFVCGCASQNNSQQFFSKEGVFYVSGVGEKMLIPQRLQQNGIFVSPLPNTYEDDFCPTIDRTRAYLKIQDGCNNFCSYCIIPYLRGRSRSRSLQSVVEECKELASNTQEIVLTGVDMSSYGKDFGLGLADLISALSDIKCRIRFGSLEANIIDDNLLQATTRLYNFCPQFHLSLQSGEDSVLKKMNRHYTTDQFLQKVQLIRKYYPMAGITTDLICGFPTETEENFAQTLKFIQQVEFSQIHIFGYSSRAGTVASKMKVLDSQIVKNRQDKASEIATKMKYKFMQSFIGKELEVLLEEEKDGYMQGYSKEYIRVGVANIERSGVVRVIGEKIIDEILIARLI